MSLPRNRSSLLKKWLEVMPNSNNSVNVKKERKDFRHIFASNSSDTSNRIGVNATASAPNGPLLGSGMANSSADSSNQSKNMDEESEDNSSGMDTSSVNGVFGWQTVNDIPLPVILREDKQLVSVRIVESKVMAAFSAYLPSTVFSCIHINCYYVTENESRLLSHINANHCDYLFGADPFTTKDAVVCLPDVKTLHEFLDTSKGLFHYGLSKSGVNWLGFINISGSHIVPYIGKKARDSETVHKYVPQSLVQSTVLLVRVEKTELTEWDASYLRMLCVYAGLEPIHIQSNDSLCLLSDLKWNASLCPLHIEECSPPNATLSNNKLNANKEMAFSSQSSVSRAHIQWLDESNGWLTTPQASTSSSALRSLHQITRVDINGFALKAINLKPYSAQTAVFVGHVVTNMLRGVSILTAHHILEKILGVRLYECTRLHTEAFVGSGVRPLPGDKLVAVDVLRKRLPQLRQIIMAGMPLTARS